MGDIPSDSGDITSATGKVSPPQDSKFTLKHTGVEVWRCRRYFPSISNKDILAIQGDKLHLLKSHDNTPCYSRVYVYIEKAKGLECQI